MWQVNVQSISQVVICLWTMQMERKGKISLGLGVLYALPQQEMNRKIWNSIRKSNSVGLLLMVTRKSTNNIKYPKYLMWYFYFTWVEFKLVFQLFVDEIFLLQFLHNSLHVVLGPVFSPDAIDLLPLQFPHSRWGFFRFGLHSRRANRQCIQVVVSGLPLAAQSPLSSSSLLFWQNIQIYK